MKTIAKIVLLALLAFELAAGAAVAVVKGESGALSK